ncbi:MAG: glycosyltransferase family 4 protein [Chloroflexi bacterium]|nr:glycosyltransferase family 4 protein [Chloroflexota bacterium]
MRIAFVGPFGLRPKGTMSARALPLARALHRRGHEVSLFLPPWDYPADAGRTDEINGVRVVHVPLPTAPSPFWHMEITRRLVRAAVSDQAEVAHCFKPKAYAGLAAWALWHLRRAGLWRGAVVVDSDDWEGAGGWNETGDYSPLQRRLFAWQESWGLRHADAVTVASAALQTIVWSLGVPPARVHYLPNGAGPGGPAASPSDALAFRQRHSLGDSPLMLLYTRFFEFSLQRVVETLNQVWQAVPEARLLIVGEGLKGEERAMLRLLEERGHDVQTVYLGWVQPDQLPVCFAAADVALHPYDDTLINRTKCSAKLVDLLAAGVPVVADSVGQNAIYIQHMRTGLLARPADPTAFAAAVVSLLKDKELGQRIGRAAREEVHSRYHWDHLASIAERAYASATASRPSSR